MVLNIINLVYTSMNIHVLKLYICNLKGVLFKDVLDLLSS